MTNSETKYVMKEVPPEYLIELGKGQKAIRMAGLQFMCEQLGVLKAETKQVQSVPGEICFECRAWIAYYDHVLEGMGFSKDSPMMEILQKPVVMHGTTNSENLKDNMVRFAYVMAETRSLVRAMRILTGCPYVASDELDSVKFNPDEAIETAKNLGIEFRSASDLMKMKSKEPTTRPELLEVIKGLQTKKGVKEYTSAYLNEHNANVLLNLQDPQLKELYNDLIQFLAEN